MAAPSAPSALNVDRLYELGEFFAAGYCELPDAAPARRYARAYRRWFESYPLEPYDGSRLYPCGEQHAAGSALVVPDYSFTHAWREGAYQQKIDPVTPGRHETLTQLRAFFQFLNPRHQYLRTPHTVGGAGFTHGIVNYGRVLSEGLESYRHRLEQRLDGAKEPRDVDFCQALLDLVEGIRAWHTRALDTLRHRADSCENAARLTDALGRVPFQPARDFYEAMVAYNFVFYLDGCDNPGRMDQVLWPYYEGDTGTDREGALSLMREYFENVRANHGWSMAIGGTDPEGNSACQELTGVCIEACRGKNKPSLELRVRDDMPDEIWDLAMDTLSTGCGQPAFYNEEGYLRALRRAELGISDEDIVKWNGGGCTETMVHGCSNVGSLDAGFNLPLILETTLKRTLGADDVTFEAILEAYRQDVRAAITEVVSQLNHYHLARAEQVSQPVRTLLVDDCIDAGRDFNDGGARYNWSVVNVAGLANVADSLESVREVVFERGEISPPQLLSILEQNFAGSERLRQRLLRGAKFGNDMESVDALATQIGEFVYSEILSRECERGGKFLPSHIMFTEYASAGSQVGATPDGRLAGTPLADSSGPMQGRDRNGPTAMLKSVAKLPQHLIAGTPVLNLRFAKTMLDTRGARRSLRALIETYFEMGGLQLQISILDRAELLDAIEHPDRHADLIVRIGGYAAHFNTLTDELKREVIKRTEHTL